MKKFIAAILTGIMMLSCVTAQAAGGVISVMNELYDKEEIHILYNDKVVQYEDVKPVNTDGRVMIPFRAALENMGATVDYNNDNRLVTAKKGNIEIKFTLMDDTIYVNKDGAQSTITMDVPMIIVSDRTLVPIRFMSNAFDMQVGWDGDTETVVIIDYDEYSAKLKSVMPNIEKMSKLDIPQNIKSSDNFSFSLLLNDIDLSLSGKADYVQTSENISSDMTVNFSGAGIDIKDKKVSVLTDSKNGKLYIKYDDKWYSLDMKKLLEELSLPEEFTEAFTMSYSAGNNIINIGNLSKPEGDADLPTAISLMSVMNAYEVMDKKISVTEKDNGGYECKFNFTNKDFMDFISGIDGDMSAEDKGLIEEEFNSMCNISASVSSSFDGKKGSSNAVIDMKLDVENMKFALKLNLDEAFEKDDSLKTAEIPSSSEDITGKLVSLLLAK